jgi:hypothetical protein
MTFRLFFIFLLAVICSLANAEVTQGDSSVARIFGSNPSSGTYEPFEIDNDVKGIVTIEAEHSRIHRGSHYFISNYIAMANATTYNVILEAPAVECHFIFTLSSNEFGFSLATYEGVTADANGTLWVPLNNNRNSTNAALTKLRLDPTNVVTTGATVIRAGILGTAGGTSQRSGGTLERLSETILKKNTKYLIRIVNLGNSTNNLNYTCSWYEV